MMTLLLVDDEPAILAALRRALWPLRHSWEVHLAGSAYEALERFATTTFDVVLSDMRMPDADGATLLEAVAERWPATIRIALTGDCDQQTAVRAAAVCHQFLAKPCETDALLAVIERAITLRRLLENPQLRGLVGSVGELPAMPRVYDRLCQLLGSGDPPLTEVVQLVERDPALTAKLLQLVNSAFFGRAQQVNKVQTAVQLLGLNVVRSIVLTHAVYAAQYGAVGGLDQEREQAHGWRVAMGARALVPAAMADAAFMAGLLHDVGKLVLALRVPLAYSEDVSRARERGVPFHLVERERHGATHAEVGGYLLGLWNLPAAVVEAVAFHHAPWRVEGTSAPVLAAVHVADALDNEAHGGLPADDVLDADFLRAQGLPPDAEAWRELLPQTTEVA